VVQVHDILRVGGAVILAFVLPTCGGDDSNPKCADPSCASDASSDGAGGELCGNVRCPAGQVCCNPLMDICTLPGQVCIQ
jgi:hypothetical protein